MKKEYKCKECGNIWPDEELAECCCMFRCSQCCEVYNTEQEALDCCDKMEKKKHQIRFGGGTLEPFLKALRRNKVSKFVATYREIGNVDKVLDATGETKDGIEIHTLLWIFEKPHPELIDAFIHIQIADIEKDEYDINYILKIAKAKGAVYNN